MVYRYQHVLPFSKRMVPCLYLLATVVITPGTTLAGPPFLTDDPETVDYRRAEVNFFTQATSSKDGTNGIAPGIDANYGIAPDVQIHLTGQFAYDATHGRDDLFSGHGSAPYGLGDTELGVKYRFLRPDADDWWPEIAIYPLAELPTGNARHGLGSGHTQEFIPLWLQKDFGKWQSFGGGGYWNNPGADNKNYWFFGWALQRQITEDFTFGGELFRETANKIGGKDSAGFNLGGTYNINDAYHLLFSVGQGIQNIPSTNQFSYYLGLQWEY